MSLLKVLVVGSSGRDHALAWAASRSPRVGRVYTAPGNAGTEWANRKDRVTASNAPIPADDIPQLLEFARRMHIDLTVVGPVEPLAAGIVDRFRKEKLAIFGPTQEAARLESSKAFAKRFMKAERIRTPEFEVFSDFNAALAYIRKAKEKLVIKADGLTGGKGVFLCEGQQDAEAAAAFLMRDKAFGKAGETVVIEKRLTGTELTVFAFSNGSEFEILDFTFDYRRLNDADGGPMTEGMGACNVRQVDQIEYMQIVEILRRTTLGMNRRGIPFSGLLGLSLMLTRDGPAVLSYLVHFSDPSAQTVLAAAKFDLVELMLQCAGVFSGLGTVDPIFKPGMVASASVVLAAPGYPAEMQAGTPIAGIDAAEKAGALIFHGGTRREDGYILASGGRVLTITATGPALQDAIAKAYQFTRQLAFPGAHFRTDIGVGVPSAHPGVGKVPTSRR